MRVAVVGAGIGGLSAGIALRNRGVDAVVFERAPETRALGAGLHLWSNAVRALEEIGLGELGGQIGVPVEQELIHTADGKLLAEWPVGEAGREIGYPSLGLSRPELLAALAEAIDPDALRMGHELTSFEDDGSGVTLRFANGAEERADFLIGADGLRSTVRKQLLGDSEPRYAGYTSWRSLVRPEPGVAPPGVLGQYWGLGVRFVYFPAGKGGDVYIVCLARAEAGGRDGEGRAKEELQERLAGFAPQVQRLVELADGSRLIRTDIADRDPIPRWGKGRVTLLGDAAHPMSPNTSQGAGLAIEDAAVLARRLSEAGASEATLRAYEDQRAKRTGSEVKRARVPGKLGRIENPLGARLRNRFISLTFGGMVWRAQKKFIAATF